MGSITISYLPIIHHTSYIIHHTVSMSARTIEGDWQYISEMGYDPVKVSIKNISGPDWIVACMIPKGNMMASTLKKVEGDAFELLDFRCSNKKETPKENKDLEEDFKAFLEKGISNIVKENKTLIVTAGDDQRVLTDDDVLKKQEEAKKAKLNTARGGRFR